MSALYVAEVVVILAATVGMFYLRRAADRAWAIRQALRPIAADWAQFQREIGERLLPAVRSMTEALAEMAPALERFGKAIRDAEGRTP